MSYNGSGTFNINSAGQPVVSGTVISSTAFNALTNDLATGLTTAITKDGQTTPTANISLGNYKITNLAAATVATDAARLSAVQNSQGQLLGTIAGTNTITAVGSPTVTAYAAGQTFRFTSAGANTGTTTLNIDSLGAKNVYWSNAACAGGEIANGAIVSVTYDGTQFQLTTNYGIATAVGIQNSQGTLLGTIAGTNTITAAATPALSAYTAGQTFRFISAGANTGATTININSLGAKNITIGGTVALVGGEIASGALVTVAYDGTQFQLQNSVMLATGKLLGRSTAATGPVEQITVGTGLTLAAGTLSSASSGGLLATYNFTAQTVALTSISNATPAVFTCTSAAHLPETGSPIQLTTSGGLPTGLSLATTYYVTNPSGSTYNVCTTLADAMAGTNKVATSSAGSGTHTMNSIYVKGSESFVIVEGWGAGGGSGGAGTSNCAAGGGSSGGYVRKKILAAALGATETITIGAGGTAGAAGGNGGTGGTTSFGAHATATGGGASNGIASSNAITAGGTPGVGASGDFNLTGFAGQPGTLGGSAATTAGGVGGATTLGGVQPAPAGGNSVGVAAKNNSGSGASGASGSGSTAGAIGGSGRFVVYVYS